MSAVMCRSEIVRAHTELLGIHRTHLAQYDVSWPPWGTIKAVWLGVLWVRKDWVHKDEMSEIVRAVVVGAGTDQQVRHLKRDGWNVEADGKGRHRLTDPFIPHPEEMKRLLRAKNRLSAQSFGDVKSAYGFMCATCGAREGEPHRHYDEVVKLQQGHCDPSKPLDNDNTIPQCQFCNRAYRDDFVFDNDGRVKTIASAKPVLRASKQVQQDTLAALKEKHGES